MDRSRDRRMDALGGRDGVEGWMDVWDDGWMKWIEGGIEGWMKWIEGGTDELIDGLFDEMFDRLMITSVTSLF